MYLGFSKCHCIPTCELSDTLEKGANCAVPKQLYLGDIFGRLGTRDATFEAGYPFQ